MLENLLNEIPTSLDDEQFLSLLQSPGLRIERIVSRGHVSPEGFWYDQEEHEWVLLVRGAARIRFQDPAETHELTTGSFLLIPARSRHRVEWTAPDERTIWLAIFWKGPLDG